MSKIDVHQHFWSAPLVQALRRRREFPFVLAENGLDVLFLAGERPYVIDTASETPDRRAELVRADGLDAALICLSSPLGIELLARRDSLGLIEAYHEGALSLGASFGVWGAVALDRPDPADVDRALSRGCIGLSLPAGALASVDDVTRLGAVLARVEARAAPLLVHPGPAGRPGAPTQASFREPLWWPSMTTYVSQMHAAWMAFLGSGRAAHPELRVIFSMLAGLAPLHAERLHARGVPTQALNDPLCFYDTSSYGAKAVEAMAAVVGREQLLYGSDRPVVDPAELGTLGELVWDAVLDGTLRALGGTAVMACSSAATQDGRELSRALSR